jgi:hypothetical protein
VREAGCRAAEGAPKQAVEQMQRLYQVLAGLRRKTSWVYLVRPIAARERIVLGKPSAGC